MTSQKIPPPPATLTRPEEYAWGDMVASRDERLARHVVEAFRPKYGHARETHYVADATKIDGVDGNYVAALGEGWQRLSLRTALGPGEHGFGFASDNAALVVAWLDAQPDGKVPVTIFTFGGKARR